MDCVVARSSQMYSSWDGVVTQRTCSAERPLKSCLNWRGFEGFHEGAQPAAESTDDSSTADSIIPTEIGVSCRKSRQCRNQCEQAESTIRPQLPRIVDSGPDVLRNHGRPYCMSC